MRRTIPTPPNSVPVQNIPAPHPEDSTTDPFRDDSVSQARPKMRSASQRISSHTPVPRTQPVLNFDPQATAPREKFGPQRVIVRRQVMTSQQRLSDDQPTPAPEPVTAASRKATSTTADVVPASASEPAKLPPLKSQKEPFDLTSSRNPLRD